MTKALQRQLKITGANAPQFRPSGSSANLFNQLSAGLEQTSREMQAKSDSIYINTFSTEVREASREIYNNNINNHKNMDEAISEILTLVKKKMQEQGGFDRDAYKNLVVETIDYFVEKGKLTDDDNLEFIEDRLMDTYESVRDEFSEEV